MIFDSSCYPGRVCVQTASTDDDERVICYKIHGKFGSDAHVQHGVPGICWVAMEDLMTWVSDEQLQLLDWTIRRTWIWPSGYSGTAMVYGFVLAVIGCRSLML